MTAGHLLFASVLTGYMALAAIVEDRDLVAHFGRQYQEYRRRVPMFVPSVRLGLGPSQQTNRSPETTAKHADKEKCNA